MSRDARVATSPCHRGGRIESATLAVARRWPELGSGWVRLASGRIGGLLRRLWERPRTDDGVFVSKVADDSVDEQQQVRLRRLLGRLVWVAGGAFVLTFAASLIAAARSTIGWAAWLVPLGCLVACGVLYVVDRRVAERPPASVEVPLNLEPVLLRMLRAYDDVEYLGAQLLDADGYEQAVTNARTLTDDSITAAGDALVAERANDLDRSSQLRETIRTRAEALISFHDQLAAEAGLPTTNDEATQPPADAQYDGAAYDESTYRDPAYGGAAYSTAAPGGAAYGDTAYRGAGQPMPAGQPAPDGQRSGAEPMVDPWRPSPPAARPVGPPPPHPGAAQRPPAAQPPAGQPAAAQPSGQPPAAQPPVGQQQPGQPQPGTPSAAQHPGGPQPVVPPGPQPGGGQPPAGPPAGGPPPPASARQPRSGVPPTFDPPQPPGAPHPQWSSEPGTAPADGGYPQPGSGQPDQPSAQPVADQPARPAQARPVRRVPPANPDSSGAPSPQRPPGGQQQPPGDGRDYSAPIENWQGHGE